MRRKQFLSTLAVASTALVLRGATASEIKEEPTAYTITETDKVFIVSGTMKEITFDCKGKSLYFKGKCNITFCRFTNVAHWVWSMFSLNSWASMTAGSTATSNTVIMAGECTPRGPSSEVSM